MGAPIFSPRKRRPAIEEDRGKLEELRRELEALRGELQRHLRAIVEGTGPVDLGEPIGRLSRIDAMAQQSMAVANRRGIETRLRQVWAPLAAIGADEYGLCRGRGEPIGCALLKARPETPFCLERQGRMEPRR